MSCRFAYGWAALALAAAACGPAQEPATAEAATAGADHAAPVHPASAHHAPASAPNVVTVTAADFYFEAPAEIPAGLTTFRLVNQGPELHHIMVYRIPEGHTIPEMLKATDQKGVPPSWVQRVGGPNAPVSGGETAATLWLEPGLYALTCVIPSAADGQPHVFKGMVRPIRVVAPAHEEGETEEPEADIVVTLTDYDFRLSAPLTAGRHTIRFVNEAEQPHEAALARLDPGRTVDDVLAWLERPEGPPPGVPIGGITEIDRGRSNTIEVDLEPGEYAWICFTWDSKDGRPHFVHGMKKQFTVG